MDRIDELKNILNKNHIQTSKVTTLKSFLTEENDEAFKSGDIIPLAGIDVFLKKEVYTMVEILQEYVTTSWTNVNLDYRFKSEKGCYFLSTLFALTSDWTLVQGQMKFENKENAYYHSWLEKENVIYDPALRVITSKDKYDIFFKAEQKHNKEEVKQLLKRTGAFTYYIKDLEEGIIFPIAYLAIYDTEKAFLEGDRIIYELENFITKRKAKRTDLKDKQYIWHDLDITNLIKGKAVYLAKAIACKENISFEEAYIKFINSSFFHKLEILENGIWSNSDQVTESLYFHQEEQKKKWLN